MTYYWHGPRHQMPASVPELPHSPTSAQRTEQGEAICRTSQPTLGRAGGCGIQAPDSSGDFWSERGTSGIRSTFGLLRTLKANLVIPPRSPLSASVPSERRGTVERWYTRLGGDCPSFPYDGHVLSVVVSARTVPSASAAARWMVSSDSRPVGVPAGIPDEGVARSSRISFTRNAR